MADFNLNKIIKAKQFKNLSLCILIVFVLLSVVVILIDEPKKKKSFETIPINITGIIDESFTDKMQDTAIAKEHLKLEELKNEVSDLKQTIASLAQKNAELINNVSKEIRKEVDDKLSEIEDEKEIYQEPINDHFSVQNNIAPPKIHAISFRTEHKKHYLNPEHYVPANTSVRAVILGGADADASVNGQSKNNGVMLFKFLEDGTLPNGVRSNLSGCRVSANSYGDISSERAFATLYKLSCAKPGKPIIDKTVNGWVFFNGKVGIKGVPLMRDGKIMQAAGISGALSGIASAAQYAQSVTQFGAYGASTVVPSGHIAPYAAYGGAAKAADTLSQYYVKRAEQYHPVIQVGAGNVVTIVFKDGFYLEPDEDKEKHLQKKEQLVRNNLNFEVPPEVLNHINNPEGFKP